MSAQKKHLGAPDGDTCRCGGTTFSAGQCMDCGRPLRCSYPDCFCQLDIGCNFSRARRAPHPPTETFERTNTVRPDGKADA